MQTVYTERHHLHTTDRVLLEGHPFTVEEVPARAEAILTAVQSAAWTAVIPPTDHGLDPILAVHDAEFVHFLRTVYAESALRWGEGPVFPWTFATRHTGRKPRSLAGLAGYYAFGFGSPILVGTWEAAYWSAQSALTAADLVQAGASVAYALCRPPGHHAAADLYGGFCYLNNAAIAARALQAGARGCRVAILDVDYHHGNGTQAIFYADPTVIYCSLHAHPDEDYPYYWGEADERGVGAGEGSNWNWPLPRSTDDAGYLAALDEALAVIRAFAPRFLVVSVGFDIMTGDEVGCFDVTAAGLEEIGRRVAALEIATVVVQEGGYVLERLGEYAVTFLRPLAERE
ncbi:MAG TPA: histone deacetylase family protein [Chloroflexi bacterium]|nr:histone deacetylase family protein [Chloroflexota bacterium]